MRPTSDMCLTPLGALAMCTYLSVQDAGQRRGAPPVPEVARAAGMQAMRPDTAFGHVCRRIQEADRSQDLVQARVYGLPRTLNPLLVHSLHRRPNVRKPSSLQAQTAFLV